MIAMRIIGLNITYLFLVVSIYYQFELLFFTQINKYHTILNSTNSKILKS